MNYYHPSQALLERLGARAAKLRLLRKLRQAELAERAGIGVATVHRFEKTGVASMENVVLIAIALNAEEAFEALFAPPPFASLDEALARPAKLKRRRISRKK